MSFAHIVTDGVEQAMTGIEAAGTVFGDAWTGLSGRITADEAGIGTGLLARSFRAKYLPDPVRAAADRLPVAYRDSAAVGRECVRDYVTADRAGAAAFGG